jgi:AcrR family transcriptional regulator
MPDAVTRPLRADAARNRARILEAARAAFAEGGLDVGVEEIARRAGVGKGTLYRRFPTKESLVLAIFDDRLADLERFAAAAAEEPDAWEALAGFLADAARLQADNQGFFEVVAAQGGGVLTPELRGRFLAVLAAPLRRAQEAHCVREDLVPADVTLLVRMLGATTRPLPDGQPMEDRWRCYLGLLLDGLRPAAATPLPAPPWEPR